MPEEVSDYKEFESASLVRESLWNKKNNNAETILFQDNDLTDSLETQLIKSAKWN